MNFQQLPRLGLPDAKTSVGVEQMSTKLYKTVLFFVVTLFAFLKIAHASQDEESSETPVLLLSFVSDNQSQIFGLVGALFFVVVIATRKLQTL